MTHGNPSRRRLLADALQGNQEAQQSIISQCVDNLRLRAQELKVRDRKMIPAALTYAQTEATKHFDRYIARGLSHFHYRLYQLLLFYLRSEVDCLGKLLESFREPLRRVAGSRVFRSQLSITGSASMANDGILKACDAIDTFKGDNIGALWNWLRAITLRPPRRRPGPALRSLDASGEVPDSDSGPVSKILRKERQERAADRVARAFRKLPKKSQTILRLRIWEEFDYRSIAKKLRITPGNARVRFYQAKKELEELLGGDGDDQS